MKMTEPKHNCQALKYLSINDSVGALKHDPNRDVFNDALAQKTLENYKKCTLCHQANQIIRKENKQTLTACLLHK